MLRTSEQNRLLHALIGDFARHFSISTNISKEILVLYYPLFKAEAEGFSIPEFSDRLSTSSIDTSTANELIEFLYWIGVELGVKFKDD